MRFLAAAAAAKTIYAKSMIPEVINLEAILIIAEVSQIVADRRNLSQIAVACRRLPQLVVESCRFPQIATDYHRLPQITEKDILNNTSFMDPSQDLFHKHSESLLQ